MLAGAPEETGCWQAGMHWTGTPVEGAGLRFCPPGAGDHDVLAALGAGPELLSSFPGNPASSPEGLPGVFPAPPDRVVFTVLQRVDGAVAGTAAIDRQGADGLLGCWIAPAFRGRGHGGATARRLTRFAFQDLGLAALKATPAQEPAEENAAAWQRALDGAGFAPTGAADAGGLRRLEATAWTAAASTKPVVLVVAAALVDVDGRVLVARRPEGKSMAGLWEFPGGKVAEGESTEAALVRELDEELGIHTRESCLAPYAFASHEYDAFRLLMPLYVCRVWKGDPVAREGQSLAWTRPQTLAGWPMPPADAPLVAMLCDLL